MLNQLLKTSLSRLTTAHDDKVHLSEISEWMNITPAEAGKILREAGLKSKPVRKYGQVQRGYARLDLMAILDRNEQALVAPEIQPLNDWVCVKCGLVFESREQKCPDCGDESPIKARIKAPAFKSSMTTRTDEVAKDLVYGSGLTDYHSRPTRDVKPKYAGIWAGNGIASQPGAVLKEAMLDPQVGQKDFGNVAAALSANSGMQMPVIPGKPIIEPFAHHRMEEVAELRLTRTPTQIVGKDDRPLPL